jgi:light-regulated signal transduction histidine kinase (bacteriophytochrome)
VLAEVVASLATPIAELRASVTHDPLPTISGDRTQLVQLFQNLIGNGIKFHSGEPPRVRISVTRETDGWLFSVADNGIGIEPSFHERIFVLFQRLHTRDKYPGTGIGLTICKKVVERHGGRIWVESDGRGSVFRFTLRDPT